MCSTHTHIHTQTHVQLSLDMHNCSNAINLNDRVHLRTKCDLKDTFPSRDWQKRQSIYLTTGRSYPEEWDLERTPISLQKLKFSLKCIYQLFGTVFGGYYDVERNIFVHQSMFRHKGESTTSHVLSFYIYFFFFCRNRWSDASNSYAICQALLTTACGTAVHVIWNCNRWRCPFGDGSHTPYRLQISIRNCVEELVVVPMYETMGCRFVFLPVLSVRINIHTIHVHNISVKLHGITCKKNVFLILSAVEWKGTVHGKACSMLFSGLSRPTNFYI